METKPYPQMEEKPMMANEPVVAYGSMPTAYASLYQPTPYEMEVIMKSKEEFQQGFFYTQEEVEAIFDIRQDLKKQSY